MTTPSSPQPGRFVRLLAHPYLYIGWSAAVLGTLVATWRVDPWLFALATLAVGMGTILIGLAGIVAQVKAAPTMRTRMIIAAFITVSGLLVVAALVALTRASWA